MLRVCEIFKSIQGESTRAGTICSFIRLSGCNLQCSWCDTPYARDEGEDRSIDDLIELVREHRTSLVEITGGEPLLQEETPQLCQRLLDLDYTVMVETNGSCDISILPEGVARIVDVKCPSSGHGDSFYAKNFSYLTSGDECKFVISDSEDFSWAVETVRREALQEIVPVIFSPNLATLAPRELAEWIIKENAPVRLGVQLHKLIWGEKRGVWLPHSVTAG